MRLPTGSYPYQEQESGQSGRYVQWLAQEPFRVRAPHLLDDAESHAEFTQPLPVTDGEPIGTGRYLYREVKR